MTVYSILLPFSPKRPEQAVPFAAFVHQRHPHRLWQGHMLALDSQQLYGYLAGMGFRIPTGTSVSLMPFRHPLDTAMQARSVAMLTGQPVVAGFGPGATTLQRSMLGARYASPLQATREYANAVRAVVRGEPVEHRGEYFDLQIEIPRGPEPTVEIGLGVLRTGMARLAGEVADVAVTWLTPPTYLAEQVVPALHAGAHDAGRAAPRVAAIVPMALRGPDRDPTELVLQTNAPHLQLPHYLDMLRRAGVDVDADDIVASARAVLQSGAFCYGDPAELAAQVAAFTAAGVDEVIVNMTGVCNKYGTRTALAELTTVFDELAPHLDRSGVPEGSRSTR